MIENLLLNETFATVVSVFVALLGFLITYFSKEKIDARITKREKEEVIEAIKSYQFFFDDKEKSEDRENNVLTMMYDNVSELREYYVISKQQARRAFSAALLACIFGFIIYIFGILATIFLMQTFLLSRLLVEQRQK